MKFKMSDKREVAVLLIILLVLIGLMGVFILSKNVSEAKEREIKEKNAEKSDDIVDINDFNTESIDFEVSEEGLETEFVDEEVGEITEISEESKGEKSNSKNTTIQTNNGVPYYLVVNYASNVVTVYGKDADNQYTVPVRAMVCSTGTATPRSGVYKLTNARYRWRALFGNVYGQYAVPITGNILFHSVPYQRMDISTLEYWEYDKLGTSASMGCIRLTVQDALWIYNNCGMGTQVEFSSSAANPLGKPSARKISGYEGVRGYDPTDPAAWSYWKDVDSVKTEEKPVEITEPEQPPVENIPNETPTVPGVDDKDEQVPDSDKDDVLIDKGDTDDENKSDKDIGITDTENQEF